MTLPLTADPTRGGSRQRDSINFTSSKVTSTPLLVYKSGPKLYFKISFDFDLTKERTNKVRVLIINFPLIFLPRSSQPTLQRWLQLLLCSVVRGDGKTAATATYL